MSEPAEPPVAMFEACTSGKSTVICTALVDTTDRRGWLARLLRREPRGRLVGYFRPPAQED